MMKVSRLVKKEERQNGWIEQTVRVSVSQNGKTWLMSVQGIGNGLFAVHECVNRPDCFAVTHLETGWRCFSWKTIEAARKAADHLAKNYADDFRRVVVSNIRREVVDDRGLGARLREDAYIVELFKSFGVSSKTGGH